MRPYTKTDRILSHMLPVCAGISVTTPLVLLATGPHWISIVLCGVAVLLLPLTIRSRVHGVRRYREIEREARERGVGIKGDEVLMFTESEVDEIGLIQGQHVAAAIRALSFGVQRT